MKIMQPYIKLLLVLLLFALPVKAEESNKEVCVYIFTKEGNTYKIKKLSDCRDDANIIIYVNQNKETI